MYWNLIVENSVFISFLQRMPFTMVYEHKRGVQLSVISITMNRNIMSVDNITF